MKILLLFFVLFTPLSQCAKAKPASTKKENEPAQIEELRQNYKLITKVTASDSCTYILFPFTGATVGFNAVHSGSCTNPKHKHS